VAQVKTRHRKDTINRKAATLCTDPPIEPLNTGQLDADPESKSNSRPIQNLNR